MYTLPTAPRPIGGVLDDAIGLYRATFKRCWLLALISGVFSAAASMYQTSGLRSVSTATTAQGWVALIHSMQTRQRSAHSNLVCSCLGDRVVGGPRRDRRATTRGSHGAGGLARLGARRRVAAATERHRWRAHVGAFLIGVGFLLLVIPGIWLWGMFQVWFVALVVEQLGPFKALGRSWRLVEGHWWRTSPW